MRGDPGPAGLPDRVGEPRRRAGEHQLPHVLGVPGGPRDRHEPAVRMAQQVEPLDAEVPADGLDVVGVVLEVVGRRIGRRVGGARAARIEQEQRPLGRELGEVAEVRRRGPGPPGDRGAAGRSRARARRGCGRPWSSGWATMLILKPNRQAVAARLGAAEQPAVGRPHDEVAVAVVVVGVDDGGRPVAERADEVRERRLERTVPSSSSR